MRGAFVIRAGCFLHLARGASRPSVEEDPGAYPRGARRVEPQLGEALRERGTAVDPSGAF